MSWARYITGWVTAEVSGAEPERFLAALARQGVAFWGAAPPQDYTLTVRVPLRAEKVLNDLAESVGCRCVIRARRGLPAILGRLRRRYVLMGCLALVLALLFVGSGFIWQIDITGNESIPDGPIRQALRECGVDIGAFWPRISQDQVRNSVILRLPGIRWITVTIRGSHAQVIVREKREHLPVLNERELVKIVAVKAGLVEDVQPLRGTALTEPGKAVLPGETLIGGYTTGRFAVQGPARAIGTVTARTWYELTAEAPLTEAAKQPGGEKTVRWALILGKTRINFYKGSSICPVGCDKIIESWPMQSAGLFTLPITVERTVFTARDTEARQQPALREEMEERLMARLVEELGEDGEVLSSQFTASTDGDVMYVTLRAECREQIGAEVPLTAEDLAEIEAKIPPKTEE